MHLNAEVYEIMVEVLYMSNYINKKNLTTHGENFNYNLRIHEIQLKN